MQAAFATRSGPHPEWHVAKWGFEGHLILEGLAKCFNSPHSMVHSRQFVRQKHAFTIIVTDQEKQILSQWHNIASRSHYGLSRYEIKRTHLVWAALPDTNCVGVHMAIPLSKKRPPTFESIIAYC